MADFPSPDVWLEIVDHRRHLHRNPEVGIELPKTHAYVIEQLRKLSLVPEFIEGAGVSVLIPGLKPGWRPIVFRADMDALPVTEDTELPLSSLTSGAMHACGHDLHTAVLLGVAKDLVSRPSFRDVILVFQPGEESHRGAVKVLEHGNLQIETAETFAVHVNSIMPVGSIGFSRGTFMAFGDWFQVDIKGPGGHASAPERVGSPVNAGADFVLALTNLTRELTTDEEKIVATVTEFLCGNAVNVIPTHGSLRGTLRAVSELRRDRLHAMMHDICGRISIEHNLEVTLTISEGYPAVVSDPDFVMEFEEVIAREGLAGMLQEMDRPSMVIEDFSYFLQRWPGTMVYVGAAVGEDPAFNHSAEALFDEDSMRTSFALFRALAPAASAN